MSPLRPTSGALHLADLADRLTMLEVACNRCDRTGRVRIDKLIAEHGREFPVPDLRQIIAADCLRRQSHSIVDLCGVHFPELPSLFVSGG